jgi:hypothetical protein
MLKKIATLSISMLLNGIVFASVTYGADLTLAWDPNPTAPDGYRLYYSTSNTSFSQYKEVAYNTTQTTVTGLSENTTYYFVVRAFNADGESGNSNLVSWQYTPPDTIAPTVSVTGPAETLESTITLSGTAGDNEAVVSVTWSNDRGGSGTASGTTAWTAAGIALAEGVNTITFTAKDAAGNTGTDSIQITRNIPDMLSPTITVSGPSETTDTVITVSGTANDNDAVTAATWSNDRGGSGTASGTTSWTAANIGLQEGINTLTFTAKDVSGNTGTTELVITRIVPDTQAPSVTVSGPSETTKATVTLTGTASDNKSVSKVTWSNDRGGGGTASGTTSWNAANISLQEGVNTITVTATDPSGNKGTAKIQINRPVVDTTAPAAPGGFRLSNK